MISCELCGAPGPHAALYPDQTIVRCHHCQLIFYDVETNGDHNYDRNYFCSGEYFDYETEKLSLRRNFQNRIDLLRHHVPAGGNLLEIGCAFGYFLELAQTYWKVQGIDISPDAVSYARERLKLNVTCSELLECPEQGERFDVICLWDTLEHLRYPVRTLEKVARSLRPGGVVAVSTGDIGSLVARLRGSKWRQIHPPTHLFYFSQDTLTAAFKKAGLQLLELTHPGQYRNYKAIVHKVFGAGSAAGIIPFLTLGDRLDFPIYLNLFDLMVAIGKKAELPDLDSNQD